MDWACAGPWVGLPLPVTSPAYARDCAVCHGEDVTDHGDVLALAVDRLWGSTPMNTLAMTASPSRRHYWRRRAGTATSSWADPSSATRRHGTRRERKPLKSHTDQT